MVEKWQNKGVVGRQHDLTVAANDKQADLQPAVVWSAYRRLDRPKQPPPAHHSASSPMRTKRAAHGLLANADQVQYFMNVKSPTNLSNRLPLHSIASDCMCWPRDVSVPWHFFRLPYVRRQTPEMSIVTHTRCLSVAKQSAASCFPLRGPQHVGALPERGPFPSAATNRSSVLVIVWFFHFRCTVLGVSAVPVTPPLTLSPGNNFCSA